MATIDIEPNIWLMENVALVHSDLLGHQAEMGLQIFIRNYVGLRLSEVFVIVAGLGLIKSNLGIKNV